MSTTAPAPTAETLFLAREVLLAADEAVGERVAQLVAEGLTEADAKERALAGLAAHLEQMKAHDEFVASLA
jgi:hypothetical protein